jgi:hypothetical protein
MRRGLLFGAQHVPDQREADVAGMELELAILEAHAALLRQMGRAGEAHDLDARANVLRAQK